ncbi:MAG: VanZ family protein [Bacilli bacterium]|nr:VanZ family protein [Bacilli bacterium]
MKKKIISIVLLLLWAGLIFYLSNQPSDVSGKISGSMIKNVLSVSEVTLNLIHNPLRESMHVFVFMVFALLLLNVLVNFNVKKIYIWCFIISMLYAISDETHQLFVPGRAFELLDLFLDLVGIVIAKIMYFNFESCMQTINDGKK